ncbi:MAG: hypothetical protein V4498_01490, partial [candidate division FCPU426 bacterium]
MALGLALACAPAPLFASLTLASSTFFGGSGDQNGLSIAITGSSLYASGLNSNGADGIVLDYDLPLGSTPVWSKIWPGLTNDPVGYSIGVSSEGIYVVGGSYNRTCDPSGGKETKAMAVKFPLTGATGGGYNGSTWDHQITSATGCSINGYGGTEFAYGSAVVDESGSPYLYATGSAEPGGYCQFYLSKMDSSGTNLWTQKLAFTGSNCSQGLAVTSLNGFIYAAGSNNSLALLRKYNSSGTLQWSRETSTGTYNAVTAFGGYIYAVGTVSGNFLIDKWDESGTLQWSKTYDRSGGTDILYGTVGLGVSLYATGYTTGSGTAGGSDLVVLTLDPATGNLVDTVLYGGANDDIGKGMATDGVDVYVVGESKSYTVNGNGSGQDDAVILRYYVVVPSPTQTSTVTPTPSTTKTFTRTSSWTPTFTLTSTPTLTVTPTSTSTPSYSVSPTITVTPTRSPTPTATPTYTRSPTPSVTPTRTLTPTVTLTSSPTSTATKTVTLTSSPTRSSTPTPTSTVTRTSTGTSTSTRSPTPTASPTVTRTSTQTATGTFTPTLTRTPTLTATSSVTPSVTKTATPTLTSTITKTATRTATPTLSPQGTSTDSPTPTQTYSASPTRTSTRTATESPTPSST